MKTCFSLWLVYEISMRKVIDILAHCFGFLSWYLLVQGYYISFEYEVFDTIDGTDDDLR